MKKMLAPAAMTTLMAASPMVESTTAQPVSTPGVNVRAAITSDRSSVTAPLRLLNVLTPAPPPGAPRFLRARRAVARPAPVPRRRAVRRVAQMVLVRS